MLAIIFFIVIPLVLFFYFKYNIGSIIVILFFLFIFYYTPYSYYLEPSFHKFRDICKLDLEIYQFNGGKIDEEYYNKVLKYFDTSLDTIDWEYVQENLSRNDWGDYLYKFKKHYDRIYHSFTLFFNDNQARKDNIKTILFYANWDKIRPLPAGNEGTGFFLGSVPISCIYFKKG